jgi:hypothetical protein
VLLKNYAIFHIFVKKLPSKVGKTSTNYPISYQPHSTGWREKWEHLDFQNVPLSRLCALQTSHPFYRVLHDSSIHF